MARELLPHHRQNLELSGLTAETIASAGIYSASAEESKRLGFGDAGSGMVIPYPSLNGQPDFDRLRPDNPWVDKKGRPAKYLTVKGAGNRLYIPSTMAQEILSDPNQFLLLTEGEKKALKANQEGFPCIALSGVWCFVQRNPKTGKSEPIPDLDLVVWKTRTVYIFYDSDAMEKDEVRWAEWRLAQELQSRGAVVKVVRLSGVHDDG